MKKYVKRISFTIIICFYVISLYFELLERKFYLKEIHIQLERVSIITNEEGKFNGRIFFKPVIYAKFYVSKLNVPYIQAPVYAQRISDASSELRRTDKSRSFVRKTRALHPVPVQLRCNICQRAAKKNVLYSSFHFRSTFHIQRPQFQCVSSNDQF